MGNTMTQANIIMEEEQQEEESRILGDGWSMSTQTASKVRLKENPHTTLPLY